MSLSIGKAYIYVWDIVLNLYTQRGRSRQEQGRDDDPGCTRMAASQRSCRGSHCRNHQFGPPRGYDQYVSLTIFS